MTKEETLRTEVRFVGRVVQVEELAVLLPDGAVGRREIVRHGGGAAIVATDGTGRVVMVRQYRKAAEQEMLEIPAGKLESGEDPAQCAIRELREETGYRANSARPLTRFYPTPGYCSEILHVFRAEGVLPGESQPDEGEHVEPLLVDLADCLAMIRDGRICDAKTIIGIQMLAGESADAREAVL
ncbi:MAG: NUDIX hydrolase [Clostridia bacterium]|nr:NUDIX hydrolase [Clostridia bacterium]